MLFYGRSFYVIGNFWPSKNRFMIIFSVFETHRDPILFDSFWYIHFVAHFVEHLLNHLWREVHKSWFVTIFGTIENIQDPILKDSFQLIFQHILDNITRLFIYHHLTKKIQKIHSCIIHYHIKNNFERFISTIFYLFKVFVKQCLILYLIEQDRPHDEMPSRITTKTHIWSIFNTYKLRAIQSLASRFGESETETF